MTTSRFQEIYARGAAPWEIGRPQPAIVDAVDAGELRGRVIDVGCGTGENALFCAAVAIEAVGVDSAPLAIERARDKARLRGIGNVRFEVRDVLELSTSTHSILGDSLFDAAIDCGCFHVLDDEERIRYAASLARVLRPGARLHLLCFSERERDWGGPRRVRREEICAAFGKPFAVDFIEATTLDGAGHEDKVQAWHARILHVGPSTLR